MSNPSSPAAPARRLWFRNGPALVWADGFVKGVVFDPVSGETHFLSELPTLILGTIDAQPVPYDVLIERLAGTIELDARARAQIVATLVSLESAELVESKAP